MAPRNNNILVTLFPTASNFSSRLGLPLLTGRKTDNNSNTQPHRRRKEKHEGKKSETVAAMANRTIYYGGP